jgi:hypothetical protein
MLSQIVPHHNIAAILPCYQTTGDLTTIIMINGHSVTSGLRIRTIINHLAKSRATDLAALKKHTSRTTNQLLLQPLPLEPGLTLFSVKVRKPRLPGDTSTGYINLHAVTGLSQNCAAQTTIKLLGGTHVPALWSAATIKKHMQSARLASAYAPHYPHNTLAGTVLKETDATAATLAPIAHKLVEVIYEILMLKTKKP